MRLRNLLLAGCGLLALLVLGALLLRPDRAVWDPFRHVGPAFSGAPPAEVRHEGYRKRTLYLEMQDGTRLAADVFLPGADDAGEGGAPGRFPAVLQYTPYSYGRALALPHLRWWERIVFWWRTGRREPILDQMLLSDLARHLVSRGYAFVAVDMRGTGASFGRHTLGSRLLGRDGAQVVAWIARQPWSNGRVGMHGQSYVTWGQLATAAEAPPALRCLVPEAMGLDLYTGLFRPGGILSERFVGAFDRLFEGLNLNRLAPDGRPTGTLPAAPVSDEDGDGDLVDEIPVTGAGDPTLFLDDGPPSYADGEERSGDLYYRATRQHRDNLPVRRLAELRFVDDTLRHLGRQVSFESANPESFLPSIVDSGVEMLVVGGWFDGPLRETVQLYASARSAPTSRLLVGPRFHIPSGVTGAYRDYLGYEGDLEAEIAAEKVRFYHRCLKGEPDAPPGGGSPDRDDAGRVDLYVMHEGWRRLETWPPAGARGRTLRLAADGGLGSDASSERRERPGTDTLAVDFTHSAAYGSDRSSRWRLMPPGGPDALMLRNRMDRSALVWETAPLEKVVTAIGHPILDVTVSASRPTADLFVYLSDVAPDGRVVNVTEGQLRLDFHRSRGPGARSARRIPRRPELPRHGFRSTDHVAAPLSGGRTVRTRIDLLPTAWRFREGHRIRVSVAGADTGSFELHPALCPGGTTGSCVPTELYVHRGNGAASRLRIPVLPSREPTAVPRRTAAGAASLQPLARSRRSRQ